MRIIITLLLVALSLAACAGGTPVDDNAWNNVFSRSTEGGEGSGDGGNE